MALVCIKIGENEQSGYSKFDKLSKHLDIIDILPRKRDSQGQLITRTSPGVKAEKHYLTIDVPELDVLTDDEFNFVRSYIRKEWEEDSGQVDGQGFQILNKIAKRKHKLNKADMDSVLGLSQAVSDEIEACAEKRRNKQEFDISTISNSISQVSIKDFVKFAFNKQTIKTIKDDLDIKNNDTVQQIIDKIKSA